MTEGGRSGRTATVAVLFCDLVGSTERQSRIGDEAADEFRAAFFAALDSAARTTGGEVVKNTGDGLMVVFRDSTVRSVACAVAMHDSVERMDVEPPAQLRVGISAGEAASEGEDWFGTPVVEAARLCSVAEPGQTLVSEVVRTIVGSRGAHRLRVLGTKSLKGLSTPMTVSAVVRSTGTTSPLVGDAPPPERQKRRLRVPMLVTVGVVIAIAAGGLVAFANDDTNASPLPAASGYTPRLEPVSCVDSLAAAVPHATCADLLVPEDRSHPNRRWIRLRMWREPGHGPSVAADPVIAMNTSDPTEDPNKSPVLDHGPLVGFVPRVGYSPDPARECPEFRKPALDVLAGPQNDPATIAHAQTALRACHGRLARAGMAFGRYTLDDAALDVLDLMRALHVDHANLSTSGDGSLVALAVVQHAPAAVRSLMLDNPVAPGSSTYEDVTRQLATSVDHYVALCQADAACNRAYPDLQSLIRTNSTQAALTPQLLEGNAYGEVRAPILLDRGRVAKTLAFALSSPAALPQLASGIKHLPPQLAADFALSYDGGFAQTHWPWASILSSLCSYQRYTISAGADLSDRGRPELAGIDDGSLNWQCDAWRAAKAPQREFAGITSPVPTLIASGRLSPWLPASAIDDLRASLPNAKTITFDTLTNGLFFFSTPPCLATLRRQFLDDPTGRLDVSRCHSPPIEFATGQ